jgi:hypothetical protein
MTDNWIAGSGVGLTWTTAFTSTDFTGAQPTNGQSLLSTTNITNGTALDKFMDISVRQSIASSTIAANANFTYWICQLKADGSTYWAPLTAGTAATLTPPWPPCCVIPIYAAASQTTLVGSSAEQGPIIIPPGTFRLIVQNNVGFTWTSTVQEHFYRTFNP